MRPGTTALLGALVSIALALLIARPAFAQPEAPAASEADTAALITRGDELLQKGNVAEACAVYEKATNAGGGSDAMLHLAQCHELLGKTASAWKEYTEATLAAMREGQTERSDRARAMASQIGARLSKLRIDVTSPRKGQLVKQNGEGVPIESWGTLAIVDPGTYTIVSTADQCEEFRAVVTVKGDADVQIVVVPRLFPPVKITPPPPQPARPSMVRTVSPMGVGAFVTTSFGAIGIAMGTAFGVMALNEVSEAEENPALCPNKLCSKVGMQVIEEAHTKSIVSTVAFSVGGVALATGVTLFLLREFTNIDKAYKSDDAPPKVVPHVGLGTVGVTVSLD